ncbi:hypothetical protein [Pseudomonas sp. RC2C2]|uniref:hypothetical protein n=1 Tax=Pseudomonas sp. RC2C2 TaxID=2834408 RepID=UPI001BCD0821|nr:hypothetical protein [Pseudomonas sp. RC2C2]MBS7600851.1 hypothetical protein [Pseudomonas sp. RC2C2]
MACNELGRVRLVQKLPDEGAIQYLRLELPYREETAAMPGQYCLLSNHDSTQPCSYISLPGRDRRFWVATAKARPLDIEGQWLSYSGPLGSGWPVPLLGKRLLVATRGYGILPLLCALDEIMCWLPWVDIHLLHQGTRLAHLPEECKHLLARVKAFNRSLYPFHSQADLKLHLQTFNPEMVYCCAPAQLACQMARLCTEHGIRAQRIWIRADHVLSTTGEWITSLDGPVHRFDRILAARGGPVMRMN